MEVEQLAASNICTPVCKIKTPMSELVTLVDRPVVEILFRRTTDDQVGITRAWTELEARFETLRGRKFYGAFFPGRNEYHVCVERQPQDDPAKLALETGQLAAGRYARVRLTGQPPALYQRITPAFTKLAERPDRDDSRPGLEYYRRHDCVDLLLPIG